MIMTLNPIEYLWGILKWKVEECNVSNIHQLRDVVMEEWKRLSYEKNILKYLQKNVRYNHL